MENLVTVLGLLITAAAVLSILFKFIKQSSIVAFIVVGVFAGIFGDKFQIPHEVIDIFTEVGIILLLFMAGLEVEFESFVKWWKLFLGNGIGQILLTVLIGSLIGFLLLDLPDVKSTIFFGLCLTFSSTIVVISYLKNQKAMESMYGQTVLGIMVLQDISAVLSLVVLKGLSEGGSLLISLGVVALKLVALIVVLFVLSKFVLTALFRFLARSKELLFLGSLGWALGVAAACELVHFSPEIGAFMAGAALSFLPYRLEVQDKVEPMKDFGIILFFIALGFSLKIDMGVIGLIPAIVTVALFVLLGSPVIMLFIGYIFKVKSRAAFMTGAIINQISEFSLILATLCHRQGLFDDRVFLLVVLATVTTLLFSSLGHQFLDELYSLFRRRLSFIDNRSRLKTEAELEGFKLEDHIVVIKYNNLAERFIEHYLDAGERVLLIDIDPEVYRKMSGRSKNLECMYADIYDPDTWEEAGFGEAKAVISCLIEGQSAEVGILKWLKDNGKKTPFFAAADSYRDALELYDNGATFVIQVGILSAEKIGELLDEYGDTLKGFRERGRRQYNMIKEAAATDETFSIK